MPRSSKSGHVRVETELQKAKDSRSHVEFANLWSLAICKTSEMSLCYNVNSSHLKIELAANVNVSIILASSDIVRD